MDNLTIQENGRKEKTMNQLQIIEHANNRVLTTAQLAEEYGTDAARISENFTRNRDRYEEGKHFYILEGESLRQFKEGYPQIAENLKFVPILYLWTEHGILLHAKSLGTDKAWATYEILIDTYFRAREIARLSPLDTLELQVKALRNIEQQQAEQDKAIAAIDARLDSMKDTIMLNTQSWREDCRRLIVRIAEKFGGTAFIRDVQAEIFQLVDARAGVSLQTRLTNKRQRMAAEGICKSKREQLNKVDVIADDKKLIEIYTAIVKEMAVKHLDPDGRKPE